MHIFHQHWQLSNWLGYRLRKSLESPLLIHFLPGQAQMKGYEPKYLEAKSLAELKENNSATDTIILSPTKQW